MDIAQILTREYPNAVWNLVNNDYARLEWHSDTDKPTEAELTALWPTVQQAIAAEKQAKVDAKASAVAKLQELGLTVEEVRVAFGLEA